MHSGLIASSNESEDMSVSKFWEMVKGRGAGVLWPTGLQRRD